VSRSQQALNCFSPLISGLDRTTGKMQMSSSQRDGRVMSLVGLIGPRLLISLKAKGSVLGTFWGR
jgi:hypothetical protein